MCLCHSVGYITYCCGKYNRNKHQKSIHFKLYLSVKSQLNTMIMPYLIAEQSSEYISIYTSLCIIDLCTDEAKTEWGGLEKMFKCNGSVGFSKSNFFESETLM